MALYEELGVRESQGVDVHRGYSIYRQVGGLAINELCSDLAKVTSPAVGTKLFDSRQNEGNPLCRVQLIKPKEIQNNFGALQGLTEEEIEAALRKQQPKLFKIRPAIVSGVQKNSDEDGLGYLQLLFHKSSSGKHIRAERIAAWDVLSKLAPKDGYELSYRKYTPDIKLVMARKRASPRVIEECKKIINSHLPFAVLLEPVAVEEHTQEIY